jgi:hypothetical protein
VSDFGANPCLSAINTFSETGSDNILISQNGYHVKIEIPCSMVSNCRVALYEITGRTVFTEPFRDQTFSFDLTHLNKGVYMVCVHTEKTIKTQKINVKF